MSTMYKNLRRILAVFVVVSMMVFLLLGCNNNSTNETQQTPEESAEQTSSDNGKVPTLDEDVKHPITYSIFVGEGKCPKGDEPVLKEISKKTGVTFNIQSVVSDAKQKLSVMLASKDFPDIIMMPRDDLFYRYLDSGELVDLKPLLQKNAPTVYKVLNLPQNGRLIDRFSNEDGKLFFLTQDMEVLREGEKPFDDLEDPNRIQKELPWHRVLYVLYPTVQEVYGKKITTLDDLYQALKAYKQKYPDDDHYAMSMSSTMGEHMIWAALSMYGYKVLSYSIAGGVYATKDGQNYLYTFKAPEILDFFKFLNKLYREGLMDQEGPMQSDEQFQQKMNSGKVFSMIGSFEPIYQANSTLFTDESTKDMIYIPQKLMAPGVDKVWQYNYAYTGNNAMVVTKKCKDPARLMRFFEALYTNDEVQILNGWGIENVDYIIKDGKRDISNEIDQKRSADPDYDLKRGINFFYSVIDLPSYTSDGQYAFYSGAPFYLNNQGQDQRDAKVTNSAFNWHKDWGGTFYKDYSEIDIYMKSGSPEAVAFAKSQALVNDAVSKMVVAGSDQEVEKIYKETLKQMENNGISLWEKAINDTIHARRSK